MATEYFNDAWRIPNNKNQSLVSNYSMQFDGTNDSVNVGLIEPFNNAVSNFAISYWVKANFNLTMCHFDFRYNGATRGVALENSSSSIIFYTGGNYGTYWRTATSELNFNEWNHIVINFDGSIATDADKCEFWINGIKKTNTVLSPGNSSTIAINGDGFLGSGFSAKLTGRLDQFCTFDYTLSVSQVATLYGGGTAVTNPMVLNPVAYYQLGDQSAYNGANYLVPNNSLQDYVFASGGSLSGSIDLANPVPLGTNKTVSFWFKLSSSSYSFSPFTSIVNSGNCYYPFVTSVSGRWYVSDAACTGGTFLQIGSGATLQVNQWLHAAAVGDGSSIKCYINGVEIFSNASDRNPTIQRLIYQTTNAQTEFSNFSIFNTNLPATGTESIASLYNNGNPPDLTNYSNISHWWKLNAQDTFDGSNWIVKDYIGSNDGTSSGMTSANLVQSDLQQTSGYSPYALSLDGTSDKLVISKDLTYLSAITISVWANKNSLNATNDALFGIRKTIGGVPQTNGLQVWRYPSGNLTFVDMDGNGSSLGFAPINDVWFHLVITYDVTNIKAYVNGNLSLTTTSTNSLALSGAANNIYIGAGASSGNNWVGDISNFSLFNTAINQAQVTTLYNQGVPSNLNNFTPKPIAWWQIGSNSSFNTNWTCLDEIGTNNAVSVNMTEDDITNGVGYSGNGLGTSSIEIVGDAPYSTANGISENMDVLNRTTDVPS